MHVSMYTFIINCRDCRNHLGGSGSDSVGNTEKAEDLRGLWTLLMLARSPEDSIAIVIMSKIIIMKNYNGDAKQIADETSACAAFLPLPQIPP